MQPQTMQLPPQGLGQITQQWQEVGTTSQERDPQHNTQVTAQEQVWMN